MASDFEECLKHSNYFADVINTHRTATAQVLAAFIEPLIKNDLIAIADLLAILKSLEGSTNSPSVDGERRHAVSVLRETLQRR